MGLSNLSKLECLIIGLYKLILLDPGFEDQISRVEGHPAKQVQPTMVWKNLPMTEPRKNDPDFNFLRNTVIDLINRHPEYRRLGIPLQNAIQELYPLFRWDIVMIAHPKPKSTFIVVREPGRSEYSTHDRRFLKQMRIAIEPVPEQDTDRKA